MDAFVPFVALASVTLIGGWLWGWCAAWRCIGAEDRKALGRNGAGICNTRATAAGETAGTSALPTAG